MSEYTPIANEVRADFVTLHTRNFDAYAVGRSLTSEQEVYGAAFDRMIAEVERAAVEKALTDAAEQFATQDGIEALMFAHDDVTAVQATEKWLIDRAAALGLTAGQEEEKE